MRVAAPHARSEQPLLGRSGRLRRRLAAKRTHFAGRVGCASGARCTEARPVGGVRGKGELVGEADQLLGLQFGERCPELVFDAGTAVAAAEERDRGQNSSTSIMGALRGQGARSASGVMAGDRTCSRRDGRVVGSYGDARLPGRIHTVLAVAAEAPAPHQAGPGGASVTRSTGPPTASRRKAARSG